MDGTIYEEETVLDGTCQLLDYIDSMGGKYVFITNNISRYVSDYIKKLNRLGIKGEYDNFLHVYRRQCFICKRTIWGKMSTSRGRYQKY